MKKKFYITAIEGKRVYFLCGPFEAKTDAENNVDTVRWMASQTDPRSDFMAFGVSGTAEPKICPIIRKQGKLVFNPDRVL